MPTVTLVRAVPATSKGQKFRNVRDYSLAAAPDADVGIIFYTELPANL